MRKQTFVSMEIVGRSDEKVINQLRNENREFERLLGVLVMTTAINIANDTKAPGFPYKTGFLKGSYQPDTRNTRQTLSAVVGSIADYAPAVENRKPFFEPAVDKNEPRFYAAIDKLIENYTK